MILITILLFMLDVASANVITNHTYFFISGFPQSGTSLIHQMMKFTPNVKTMFNKCDIMHGSKNCMKWNYEGQWIFVNKSKSFSQIFKPGVNIPCNDTLITPEISQYILNGWNYFWDINDNYTNNKTNPITIFVEKSPQSMTKIKCIHNIFKHLGKVKFLIMIKHPVSLNNALPNRYYWLNKMLPINKVETILPNTRADIAKNFGHFIPFMSNNIHDNIHYNVHSNTHNIHNTHNTSMSMSITGPPGWLDTMHTLLSHLSDDQLLNPVQHNNIRILRYEHFLQPYSTCKAIYQYMFDSNTSIQYIQAIQRVCDIYFKPTIRPIAPLTPPSSNTQQRAQKYTYTTNTHKRHTRQYHSSSSGSITSIIAYNKGHHRRLTFHGYESTTRIEFDYTRLKYMYTVFEAFKKARLRHNLDEKVVRIMTQIEQALIVYGYGLDVYDMYSNKSTVLDPWDLIKLYKQS